MREDLDGNRGALNTFKTIYARFLYGFELSLSAGAPTKVVEGAYGEKAAERRAAAAERRRKAEIKAQVLAGPDI